MTFLRSWRYLGGVWVAYRRPLAFQDCLWELQAPFLTVLGSHLGGLGASFFDRNRVWDLHFSVSVFGTVSGSDFNGFLVFQACPGT